MGEVHNAEQCSPKISSFTHPDPNDCTNSSRTDLDSKSIRHEFESGTGHLVVVSDHDLFNRGLKKVLECNSPKKRRSKNKRNCCTKQNGEKGGRLRNHAASFGGECAAVLCCCPCALLHFSVFALVKFPLFFAKKALCCSRKSIPKEEEEEEEDKSGKWRFYTSPWSCRESPQAVGPVDRLSHSTLDTQKIWSELYAGGHMGFGGLPFETNQESKKGGAKNTIGTPYNKGEE